MFRFIHTGDLHLDSAVSGLAARDDPRIAGIVSAPRRAFTALVDRAMAERVDAFLIAGDFWDRNWSDMSVGFFVQSELARLKRADIPVVAILGNHDAEASVTDHVRRLDGIHIFGTEAPGSVECGQAVIHGISYPRYVVPDNLAIRFPQAVPGRFNVGLLHTGLDDSPNHGSYAPCKLSDLAAKGYDYWALGHVHTRRVMAEGRVAYCGVLQGRHVGEAGQKGAFLVTLDGRSVRAEPIDLSLVAWHVVAADVSGGDLDAAIRDALAPLAGLPGETLVVRLALTGESADHHALPSRARDLTERAEIAARGVGERIVLERLVFQTRPRVDAVPAVSDAFARHLARAAADPDIGAKACELVVARLGRMPGPVRDKVLADWPALRAIVDERDPAAALAEAADDVTGRL